MGGILEEIGMLGRGLMRGSKSGNVPRLLAREAESGLATRFAPPPATAPMAVPVAPSGIRAYHGSPHSFDKFDISKIGTGEGAQVYGHGLYFAEAEDTAKAYRNSLTRQRNQTFSYEGKPVGPDTPYEVRGALEWLSQGPKQGESTVDFLARRANELEQHGQFMRNSRNAADHSAADMYFHGAERIRALDPTKLTPAGSMYEVNIKADPEHFLDWDKPLSEQPHGVRQKLGGLGILSKETPENAVRKRVRETADKFGLDDEVAIQRVYDDINKEMRAASDSGDDALYDQLTDMDYAIRQWWDSGTMEGGATGVDPSAGALLQEFERSLAGKSNIMGARNSGAASDKLREAGIPGIKYLDAGSRAPKFDPWLDIYRAGDGPGVYITKEKGGGYFKGYDDAVEELKKRFPQSLNYVVFDDSIIEVVKKYGIAGALGAGLITQEMADQMRAQGVPDSVSHKTSPAGPSAMPTRERFGG